VGRKQLEGKQEASAMGESRWDTRAAIHSRAQVASRAEFMRVTALVGFHEEAHNLLNHYALMARLRLGLSFPFFVLGGLDREPRP
jgi:hypothetical protein